MRIGSWLGSVRRVGDVHGRLTCISDETFFVIPCDVRRRDTVALVVDEDFHLSILHDADAGISRAQVDADDCRGSAGIDEEDGSNVPGPVISLPSVRGSWASAAVAPEPNMSMGANSTTRR